MKAYYEARAREYDEWWAGVGLFQNRDRPGWHVEVRELERVIRSLPPGRTLDVACGTGFLTRHLRGKVTALDQSESMLDVARPRLPHATLVRGDALDLPFDDGAFDRVFTANFYGHLEEKDRVVFLGEARRVARELVVVDASLRDDHEPVEWQERILRDGSRWQVYKRFFAADALTDELGGGDVLHDGRWFVVVRA